MNTAIVLVLAVVCFFIGIIAAYLLQSLRDESKPAKAASTMQVEDELREELSTASTAFSQVPAFDEQKSESTQQPTPTSGMIEIARFWRDQSSGEPSLEIDGVLFHAAEQMGLSQLDKLEAVLKEFSDWVGKPTLAEGAPIEAGAFLTRETSERTSFKPPKLGPLEIIKNTLDSEVRSALKSTPKSLAAQVDEILQDKLAGSSLAERGIRIMDTPSSDLVVMVGLEKYDGVDAVPDAEIQAVIREAVAEWGRRASVEGGTGD
jgi:hypothetical protein